MSRYNIIRYIFIIVVIMGFTIHISPLSDYLDKKFLDYQFESLRNYHPTPVSNDVVIIGIDEHTFKEFREPIALWHPYLGNFFNAMAVAKPAALGADLILPDRSYDFITEGNDRKLLSGLLKLKKVSNIIIGETINENKQIRPIFAPIISVVGQDALGLVLVKYDADGKVRNYESYVKFGNNTFQTLSTLIAEKIGYETKGEWINYLLGDPFSYISMQDVINWYERGNVKKLEKYFKGKIVLIGSVLPFTDRHSVPVRLYANEPETLQPPGILIHAQILRTILNNAELTYTSQYINYFLLVISLLFYFIGQRLKFGITLLGTFILGLPVLSTYILSQSYILPVVSYLVIALLAFFIRYLVEGVFTHIEKNRLNNSFGKYVSPNVMEQILAGVIVPEMKGQRRNVCVLFSDIRNFTGRSELQPPERIILLLNKYFNLMTEVVHKQGGTVDKFIGDGLMAFFGAPNILNNPTNNAFYAAKEMLIKLKELNMELKVEDIEEIQIGIGLHVGETVVGHVGSDSRHEYTVIGDTVNLASRLEGRTKELGYPIICSEAVYETLESKNELTEIGYTSIKGRSDAKVYGWKPVTT